MNPKRKAGSPVIVLAALFVISLFCSGCGEVFRPVANPVPLPGGDPQRVAHAIVLSANGADPGNIINLDVSGDTNIGTIPAGRNPVHATALLSFGQVYAANQNDDSVTTYSSLLLSNPITTISLPVGARPVFAASTEAAKVYIAESARARVGVIAVSLNALSTEVAVGNNPVALAETPDGKKLYCVNNADNSVTVINTTDLTVNPAPITVGSSPVWAAASSDGAWIFVVNQGSNTVSVISTASDTKVADIPVGAGPNFVFFDKTLKRAYVTSPAGNSLSILDASGAAPALMATAAVGGAPCSGAAPVSVVAIADGSRAYVANRDSNNVCVLSTLTNTFTKQVPLGTAPVSIAAAPDGTKVYTANSGSGDVSVILTSNDTELTKSDGITPARIPTGATSPTFVLVNPTS